MDPDREYFFDRFVAKKVKCLNIRKSIVVTLCLFVCFNGRPGKLSLTREYPIGWDLAHVQEQINALLPSDEGKDE